MFLKIGREWTKTSTKRAVVMHELEGEITTLEMFQIPFSSGN